MIALKMLPLICGENDMKNNTQYVGMTGGTLLQVCLIVLKIVGLIDWEWKWVLALTWVPLVFSFALLLLAFLRNASKQRRRENGK